MSLPFFSPRLTSTALALSVLAILAPCANADGKPQDLAYLSVEAASMPAADRQLAELFAPPPGYRDLTITGNASGQKLLTLTSERILSGRGVRKFTDGLLAKGISIYGATYYGDFSWDRTVHDAAITVTRTVQGEPDTIEVSEGLARDPKTNKPLMPLTASIHEISIPVREDFGTAWQKLRIFPAAEPAATEPKTGRYPASKVRLVRGNDPDRKHLFYAVRGNLTDVEQFFDQKLRLIHKTVIVSGEADGLPSPAEVFGIKTSAQVIVLSGYTFVEKRLTSTQVTLRRASDPNLSPYVEIEVTEN